MNRMKVGVFFVAALALFFAGCAKGGTKSADTIKIGGIFELTGVFAAGMGPDANNGAKGCVDWINDKGGVNIKGTNYLLELISEDCKSSPEGAIAAANRLVFDKKVKFIIGPIVPFLSIPIVPLLEQNKVVHLIFGGPGSPMEASTNMPFTFAGLFQSLQIPPVYDFLVKKFPKVKKVAITSPADPTAPYWLGACKVHAEKRGLEVVYMEPYPFGTMDFNPVVSKILASKPDAVEIGQGITPWHAGLIKSLREMGFKGVIFTSSYLSDPEAYIAIAGKDNAYSIFGTVDNTSDPKEPYTVKDYKKYMTEKYQVQKLSGPMVGGWEMVYYIAQAIEAAQSTDPAVVADLWAKMTKIETIQGPTTMGGKDFYGVNHVVMRPVCIGSIDNGAFKFEGYYKAEIPLGK